MMMGTSACKRAILGSLSSLVVALLCVQVCDVCRTGPTAVKCHYLVTCGIQIILSKQILLTNSG